MPRLAGYQLAETLLSAGDFVLWRGEDPNGRPVLIRAPAALRPAASCLQQLNHEWALTSDIESGWAARPLRLEIAEGRPLLVLEDPGGEPLARLLGAPLAVPRFLRLAAATAAALSQLH